MTRRLGTPGRSSVTAVVVAIALATLGGCEAVYLLSQRAESADLAWSPDPIEPDPVLTRYAEVACGKETFGIEPGTLALAVQDQRGPGAAAVVFWTGEVIFECFVYRRPDGALTATQIASSGVETPTASIEFRGRSNGPGTTHLHGRVGPSVERVQVTLEDGTALRASVRSGHFLAW